MLAKCMEELCRHGNKRFSLEFILMNPGYSKENLDLIHKNAQTLGINLKEFDYNIFELINGQKIHATYVQEKEEVHYITKHKVLAVTKLL